MESINADMSEYCGTGRQTMWVLSCDLTQPLIEILFDYNIALLVIDLT